MGLAGVIGLFPALDDIIDEIIEGGLDFSAYSL